MKGAFTGAIKDREGAFERANKGTLFLDEIGNLSHKNQVKLLRVLQEKRVKPVGGNESKPVDTRILVATNVDLKKLVDKGDFREDLFHRINEFQINISPIRERPEDIELFVRHFILTSSQELKKSIDSISEEALDIIKNHTWSGNLRELKNVIKRAVLFCDGSRLEKESVLTHLTKNDEKTKSNGMVADINKGLSYVSEAAEKSAIEKALQRTGFNKTETAKLLKIDRKTLYNKMNDYGINY